MKKKERIKELERQVESLQRQVKMIEDVVSDKCANYDGKFELMHDIIFEGETGQVKPEIKKLLKRGRRKYE